MRMNFRAERRVIRQDVLGLCGADDQGGRHVGSQTELESGRNEIHAVAIGDCLQLGEAVPFVGGDERVFLAVILTRLAAEEARVQRRADHETDARIAGLWEHLLDGVRVIDVRVPGWRAGGRRCRLSRGSAGWAAGSSLPCPSRRSPVLPAAVSAPATRRARPWPEVIPVLRQELVVRREVVDEDDVHQVESQTLQAVLDETQNAVACVVEVRRVGRRRKWEVLYVLR